MATPRGGKPYVWVTWIAKILGGNQCVWAPWFKSRYRYDKHEEQALDLAQWNREHNEMMRARRREMEREGWTVTEESGNAFKVEGDVAIVAGKADLVGRRPGLALVVDGKTGRERESDFWQVLFYLYALPKEFPDLRERTLEGEIQYKRGDQRMTVTPAELTPERMGQIVDLIRVIGGPVAPPRVPSAYECKTCNIGPKDCPVRVREQRPVAVGEF